MTIEGQRGHFGRLGEAGRGLTLARTPAFAVAICAAVALTLIADAGSAQSADSRGSQNNPRIAAIGVGSAIMSGEAKGAASRAGAGVSDDTATIDLRTLLAQYAPAAAAEAQARRDTVLLTIPLPAPAGVEDDIAKEHGVEIADRFDMPEFKLRMVKVRIPPGRSVEAALTALKQDHRIKFAQISGTYRPANLDSQAKAPEGDAKLKSAPEQGSNSPSIRSYGVAAPKEFGGQESGGMAKAAAPAARRGLAPKTHKASTSGVTASVQRLTADEPFVGADGRLR